MPFNEKLALNRPKVANTAASIGPFILSRMDQNPGRMLRCVGPVTYNGVTFPVGYRGAKMEKG